MLIGGIMMILGVGGCLINIAFMTATGEPEAAVGSFLLLVGGLILYLVGRIGAWWFHG